MTDMTLSENSGVILDQNRLRLPDNLEEQIKKLYTKILRVSKTEGLEQRIGDDKIGEFCKKRFFNGYVTGSTGCFTGHL